MRSDPKKFRTGNRLQHRYPRAEVVVRANLSALILRGYRRQEPGSLAVICYSGAFLFGGRRLFLPKTCTVHADVNGKNARCINKVLLPLEHGLSPAICFTIDIHHPITYRPCVASDYDSPLVLLHPLIYIEYSGLSVMALKLCALS